MMTLNQRMISYAIAAGWAITVLACYYIGT